ncbi:MAG: methyl-accepting chemotaxis protein [Candidatus Polarisedimenticolaceae bacterium]|nr:methyl-accepting chemotaxis protein [Candidatus Polarisedimenticolaceae bacterium]
MNELSLKRKLAMGITAIILVTVLLGTTVFYSLQKSQWDSDIVNTAGRQRMLSQSMSKSALGFSLAKNALHASQATVTELDRYITKMRGTYASMIIGPAKKAGLKISMHPEKEYDPAIPFPATFARIIGEKFATGGSASVDIITDDPINPAQGLKDAIDREAFAFLSANKGKIFFKEVERDNKLYLRYYTADNAVVQDCASCHIAMKGKPFKVGDMLGIRRFSLLFSENIAQGHARLNPSLEEYEMAAAIFTQTLKALKSGGEYPTNLKMTEFNFYAGSDDPGIQANISKIEGVFADFTSAVTQLTTSKIGSDDYWQAQQDVPSNANKLLQLSNKLTNQFADIAHANQSNVKWAVAIMILTVIVAFIGLFLMINRTVLSPVEKITQIANSIAQGDLTQKIDSHRQDEIGALSTALDQMSQSLNSMITKINDTAHSLVLASGNIHEATQQVTDGAVDQSRQTEVVAVSANEMEIVSQDISRNTTEAADAANQASQVAVESGSIVHQSVDGMARISSSVAEAARNVELLAEHSDQIGKIVSVIDDIANQTNLLALNAAIEAARAGDQGRGFAVVADEVRHLATRTTDATKEIAEMIRNIQNGTEAAVTSMQEGRTEVEAGSTLVSQTGQSLEQIVEVVEGLTDRIQQIATASQEQSASMAEITTNITNISGVANTAKEQAQLSLQSCGEVAGLANEMQNMIRQFKI